MVTDTGAIEVAVEQKETALGSQTLGVIQRQAAKPYHERRRHNPKGVTIVGFKSYLNRGKGQNGLFGGINRALSGLLGQSRSTPIPAVQKAFALQPETILAADSFSKNEESAAVNPRARRAVKAGATTPALPSATHSAEIATAKRITKDEALKSLFPRQITSFFPDHVSKELNEERLVAVHAAANLEAQTLDNIEEDPILAQAYRHYVDYHREQGIDVGLVMESPLGVPMASAAAHPTRRDDEDFGMGHSGTVSPMELSIHSTADFLPPTAAEGGVRPVVGTSAIAETGQQAPSLPNQISAQATELMRKTLAHLFQPRPEATPKKEPSVEPQPVTVAMNLDLEPPNLEPANLTIATTDTTESAGFIGSTHQPVEPRVTDMPTVAREKILLNEAFLDRIDHEKTSQLLEQNKFIADSIKSLADNYFSSCSEEDHYPYSNI